MYILAGMLELGLVCNALIRPVSDRYFKDESQAQAAKSDVRVRPLQDASQSIGAGQFDLATASAWSVVAIPLLWGVWVTITKAVLLFS